MQGNLEERLTALEERRDMESGPRTSIDRDLSALAQGQRAANHLLQALAITQSEHTQVLELHTGMLKELGSSMSRRFEEVDGRLDRIDGRFAEIIGILTARES